jgi:hypothetical protein
MSNLNHIKLLEGQKLKIGLLVDSNFNSKYVCDLAKWSQVQPNLEISTLILLNARDRYAKSYKYFIELLIKREFILFLRDVRHTFLTKLENYFFLKKCNLHKDHLTEYDLFDFVKDHINLSQNFNDSHLNYKMNMLERIREKNIDIFVMCSSINLQRDIQTLAKYGVLNFNYTRNHLAGFWEVLRKKDSTRFVIERICENMNDREVLFQGQIVTSNYFLLNQANLYIKLFFYIKKILSDIAANNVKLYEFESIQGYVPNDKEFNNRILFGYLFKLFFLKTNIKIVSWVLKKHDRFSVGFKFCDWRNLDFSEAQLIRNVPNHYLADPFVVSVDNRHYCFVEDYNIKISRGCISLYELTENGAISYGEILNEPFHMSYPFVFIFQNKYYMVPETSKNKDIRIYEAEIFPYKWKFLKTIFSDIDAADTTIIEKDGLWWLFSNIDSLNNGDHGSELFIFYADNPLSDTWVSHPKNPIICNSLNARMGGFIHDENAIFRVSQRQAFNIYGHSVNVNKVNKLTKTDYVEKHQFSIQPDFYSKLNGTHHLNSNGFVTVFDFHRKETFE